MKQGQEPKFRCNSRDEDGSCRRDCSVRARAHRYPVCSFGRTAIEVPGFGKHSHQLGSNPAESKAQLLTLAGLVALRKYKGVRSQESGVSRPPRRTRRGLNSDSCLLAPDFLFHFDGGARIDELLLDRLRFFLAHAFLHRLRRAVHQVLRFLQPEAGHFANGLDDVDLVCARAGQYDGLMHDGKTKRGNARASRESVSAWNRRHHTHARSDWARVQRDPDWRDAEYRRAHTSMGLSSLSKRHFK